MSQISILPAFFFGVGLDDLHSGGTVVGLAPANAYFTVFISATGGPDHFTWSKNGGAQSSAIAINGLAQALADGVTVHFAATTGHTLNDGWTITVAAAGSVASQGFIQIGVGARFRDAQSKIQETLSVLDFGAVADGDTDDGPAFNRALAALAQAGGGNLYIPGNRTYAVATPIFFNNYVNITMQGDGASSVLLRTVALTPGYGVITLGGGGCSAITLQDFLIDGQINTPVGKQYGSPTTAPQFGNDPMNAQLTDDTSIWIDGLCTNIAVNRLTIQHSGGYAILVAGVNGLIDHVLIENSLFQDNRPHLFGTTTGDLTYGSWTGGIHYQGEGAADGTRMVHNLTVDKCTFRRNTGNCVWGHLYGFLGLHQNIRVTNSHFEDCGLDAIEIGGTSGFVVNGNSLRRIGYICTTDTGTPVPKFLANANATGIDTSGWAAAGSYTNNVITSVYGGFMDLDGHFNSLIAGNVCRLPVSGDPEYVEDQIASLTANVSYGCQTGNSSLNNGASNVTITGNTFMNMGAGAIRLACARNAYVTGNQIQHPATAVLPPITLFNTGAQNPSTCVVTSAPDQRATNCVIVSNSIAWSPASTAAAILEYLLYYPSSVACPTPVPMPWTTGDKNWVSDNRLFGNCVEFQKDPSTASTVARLLTASGATSLASGGSLLTLTAALSTDAAINVTLGNILANDGFSTTSTITNAIQAPFGGVAALWLIASDSIFLIKEPTAAVVPLSNSGQTRIYMDHTTNLVMISVDGAPYVNLLGSGGGSGSAVGPLGQVQYSGGAGAFASDSGFTYTPTDAMTTKAISLTAFATSGAPPVAVGGVAKIYYNSTINGFLASYSTSAYTGIISSSFNAVAGGLNVEFQGSHFNVRGDGRVQTSTQMDFAASSGATLVSGGATIYSEVSSSGALTVLGAGLVAKVYNSTATTSTIGFQLSNNNFAVDGNGNLNALGQILCGGAFVIKALSVAPSLAAAGYAKLYYNSVNNALQVSYSTGAYTGFISTVFNSVATGSALGFQLSNNNFAVDGNGNLNALGQVLCGSDFTIKALTTPPSVSAGGYASLYYNGTTNALLVSYSTGAYTGFISTSFNAIAGGLNTEFQGSHFNVRGDGRVQTSTQMDFGASSGPTLLAGGATIYSEAGSSGALTVLGAGLVAGVINSTATGATIGFQLHNNNFAVDGNGNLNALGQINSQWLVLNNQSGAPAPSGARAFLYATSTGLFLSLSGVSSGAYVNLAAGASVPGANTQIIYNNIGAFAASANLTFNGSGINTYTFQSNYGSGSGANAFSTNLGEAHITGNGDVFGQTGNFNYNYTQYETVGFLAGPAIGQFRAVQGSYGVIFRNDGTNFYLLATASGSPYAGWSSLRPIHFNLVTGLVSMENNLSVLASGLTPIAMGGSTGTVQAGTVAYLTSLGGSTYLCNNVYSNGSIWIYAYSQAAAIFGMDYNGNMLWYNMPTGTAGAGAGPLERMQVDINGDFNLGGANNASNTLRYLDTYNQDTGNSAGVIHRLITQNAANSGLITVDMVKYRTGAFYINNNEPGAACSINLGVSSGGAAILTSAGGFSIQGGECAYYTADRSGSGTSNAFYRVHDATFNSTYGRLWDSAIGDMLAFGNIGGANIIYPLYEVYSAVQGANAAFATFGNSTIIYGNGVINCGSLGTNSVNTSGLTLSGATIAASAGLLYINGVALVRAGDGLNSPGNAVGGSALGIFNGSGYVFLQISGGSLIWNSGNSGMIGSAFNATGNAGGNTFQTSNNRFQVDNNGNLSVTAQIAANTLVASGGVTGFDLNVGTSNGTSATGGGGASIANAGSSVSVACYDNAGNCHMGSAGFFNSSDARLKDNIRPVGDSALDLVLALRPVRFRWKGNGNPGAGFLAHEVREVLPDLVAETGGYLSVSREGMVPWLVGAIQSLSRELSGLRNNST